jgi:hypothetical protein
LTNAIRFFSFFSISMRPREQVQDALFYARNIHMRVSGKTKNAAAAKLSRHGVSGFLPCLFRRSGPYRD